MNNRDFVSSSEMINSIMNILSSENSNEIFSVWKRVVSNIGKKKDAKPEDDEICLGERLANNTRVVDLKNGVLLVEANHSGWIQYLRMYQNFILKGLNWAVPDLKIHNLAFRLAGSNVNLSNQYDELVQKEKNRMSEKIDSEEKKIAEKLGNQKKDSGSETGGLPPEIMARFEKLKKEMENDDK